MDELKFGQNWNNKLHCACFTTFRLHNPVKYRAGAILKVKLGNYLSCQAQILDIKTFRLDQVSEWVARLDTGYSKDEFVKLVQTMYKNKGIDFETQQWDLILLKTLKP